jgi:hypothetical protein
VPNPAKTLGLFSVPLGLRLVQYVVIAGFHTANIEAGRVDSILR